MALSIASLACSSTVSTTGSGGTTGSSTSGGVCAACGSSATCSTDCAAGTGCCATPSFAPGAAGSGWAIQRQYYDYVPTAMKDGNDRVWWCGGPQDHILYAETGSFPGPFHAYGSTTPNTTDDAFDPSTGTFNPTTKAFFDNFEVCDPSRSCGSPAPITSMTSRCRR